VLLMSDRIAVMYEGRIVGVFDRRDADREELGLLMGGHAPPADDSEAEPG
jgi:general nucleoside transport system ATP-binding protein